VDTALRAGAGKGISAGKRAEGEEPIAIRFATVDLKLTPLLIALSNGRSNSVRCGMRNPARSGSGLTE
jgi:hypothetical protein